MNLPVIRKATLSKNLDKSDSTIDRDVQKGLLTPPIKFGERVSAWPEFEVDIVVAARIEGRSEDDIKQIVADLIVARKNIVARIIDQFNAANRLNLSGFAEIERRDE